MCKLNEIFIDNDINNSQIDSNSTKVRTTMWTNDTRTPTPPSSLRGFSLFRNVECNCYSCPKSILQQIAPLSRNGSPIVNAKRAAQQLFYFSILLQQSVEHRSFSTTFFWSSARNYGASSRVRYDWLFVLLDCQDMMQAYHESMSTNFVFQSEYDSIHHYLTSLLLIQSSFSLRRCWRKEAQFFKYDLPVNYFGCFAMCSISCSPIKCWTSAYSFSQHRF